MLSSGFAHLQPLRSQLTRRTLTLRLAHFPGELTRQLQRAPRPVHRHVLGLEPEQEQRGHDGSGHRAFHPGDLCGNLMWPQSHDAFEFFHQQLYPPPAAIDGHHLACAYRLGPIGHEARRLLRPVVAPTCAEHHGDVSERAPPPPLGVDPERAPALTIDGRNADARIPPAGQMSDERLAGLAIGEFPGAGQGQHLPGAQLLNQGHVRPGGRGGVGDDDELLGPGWGPEVAQPLAAQGVFGLIGGIVLAPEQRTIDRDTIDAPLGQQNDEAESEPIRMVLAEACRLGHGMLGPPLALQGAVGDQREEPSLGGGKACKAWSANHHRRAVVHP
jgi:hypothetical protein